MTDSAHEALTSGDLDPREEPFAQFDEWLAEAQAAEINDPAAAALATVAAILPSSSTAEEIATAARVMQSGLAILPPDILALWRVANLDASNPDVIAEFGLTHREMEVLEFLAQGLSNKVIAHELGINDTTVRVYVRSILHKLGVQNRTQAALFFSGHNKPSNGHH
jgi:DNA-binding NarL/FixJ family response regulator